MFSKVLVPLDGSANAEAVLPHVLPLVRKGGGELILLRVVPEVPEVDALTPPAELIRDAESYLRALNFDARRIVRVGPVTDVIREVSGAASLIAMSTHGRSGISRLLFGSVTEEILRTASKPLFVARAPADREIRTILVPVDGSAHSLAVLDSVRASARLLGARVVLLHVNPEPSWSRNEMARIADELGVPATILERSGDPASEILRVSADLIAMSTHGRTGVKRWVLGSVTEKVLRSSEVPLLIVRSPG